MDHLPTFNKAIQLDEVLKVIPRGYRFIPSDMELIEYLKAKNDHGSMIHGRFFDVDVYKNDPNTLRDLYMLEGEKHMYLFTPRSRKYKNGNRPNRAVLDIGFWNPGKEHKIEQNGTTIGSKRSLVFCRGKPKDKKATDWHMQEFTLEKEIDNKNKKSLANSNVATDEMQLDACVLCEIYQIKQEDKDQNKKEVKEDHEAEQRLNPTFPEIPIMPSSLDQNSTISMEIVPTPMMSQLHHGAQQHLNPILPEVSTLSSLDQNSTNDLHPSKPIEDASGVDDFDFENIDFDDDFEFENIDFDDKLLRDFMSSDDWILPNDKDFSLDD